MTGNNPNLGIVNINAHTKLVKFYRYVLKILRGNEIVAYNSGTNVQKMTGNNPKLIHVNINAHTNLV